MLKRAVRSALRKAAKSIEITSKGLVKERYPLKPNDLRGAYEIKVEGKPAEPIDNYKATIGARVKRYSLMRFEPKQTPEGVKYRAKAGGKMKLIRHAFIASVNNPKSGESQQVFIRTKLIKPGVTSKRKGKYRSEFPITAIKRLRLAGVLEKQAPDVIPEVANEFVKSFELAWNEELLKHGLR